MKACAAILIVASGIARAQASAPWYDPSKITDAPLMPGAFVSIYGHNLGPARGCLGQPDPRKNESAEWRPYWGRTASSIFPTLLCGVQVMFNKTPAQLLYASEERVDVKIPVDAPARGTATLRLVYQGRSGPTAVLPLGVTVELDGPAHVGGPVWLRVHPPNGWSVSYPIDPVPSDFVCEQLEVRSNGTLLPRIPVPPSGGGGSGPACRGPMRFGNEAIPATGRLPLHLAYHFNEAGTYEVRYSRWSEPWSGPERKLFLRSDWTRIQIGPAEPWSPGPPPSDRIKILTEYLPNIVGIQDDAHLRLIEPFLYHPERAIRSYAAGALLFWPKRRIERFAADAMKRRGPNELLLRYAWNKPENLDSLLPYLTSNDPIRLRGAVEGIVPLLVQLSPEARARAETAFVAAADHLLQGADPTTGNLYVNRLAALDGARARPLLWSLVQRGYQAAVALNSISLFKNPEDLPRIQALLETSPANAVEYEYASLMMLLRSRYGDAALPVLETALRKSSFENVKRLSAQELALAGRKSGFAYLAGIVVQGRQRAGLTFEFLQQHFSELRTASDQQIVEYVKSRQ